MRHKRGQTACEQWFGSKAFIPLARVVLLALGLIALDCPLGARAYAQTKDHNMQASASYVEYDLKGRRYRVPEKYLDVPPRRDQLGRVNTTQGQFGFSFWISDGSPSPVPGISLGTFWPKQQGRPSSGDGDFVVKAYRVEVVPPNEMQRYVLPSQRLRNGLEYLIPENERTEDAIYGLKRYTLKREGIRTIFCASPANADPEVVLLSEWAERDWSSGRPLNPSWKTEVFSKSEGLLVALTFPETALRRWSDVVCQTLTLIRSWQVPRNSSTIGCVSPLTN